MGELSATILAAEEGGGTSNFLIPNGTFFVVLLIFLIVLGVIGKWVVPPVGKVLAEREAMLAKTAADNRKAAEQVAAAQADFDETMAGARGEASAIRDEARTEGRKVVDEFRTEASGEVSEKLQSASAELTQNASAASTELESSVTTLSATLASRILGVDVTGGANERESLMSTFIGQLIGFAVIVWLVVKWVVPPVSTMMKKQQEAVRAALAESASAAQKLASADETHAKALEDARSEAAKVTEEARTDSARIAEQLREQAAVEAERIKAQGNQQVHMLRQQTIRELRHGLGSDAFEGAEQLVRQYVADPGARSSTVDRFLDDLEAMSPSPVVYEAGATLSLRAASREALVATVKKFDQVADGLDVDGLRTLAEDLTAVAKLLIGEPALNRHLAEPSDDAAPKERLVQQLFGGKVSAPSLDVLKTVAAQRWSTESNLIDAIEHVARLALLVRADRANEGEEVEEQLFRFGRVLDEQPRLAALLSDYTTPADGRVALLRTVLESSGTVNQSAEGLLVQTVDLLRGERADETVADLTELAVARRGEVIANVTAAADLTEQQRTRLTEVLTRIYGHPVSVQLNVDPALLGGLLITVGDEVIDGSISSRLTAARTGLPD